MKYKDLTDKQTDRQTNRQTGRQTDRQIDSFSALFLDVANHKCEIFCSSATVVHYTAQIPVKFKSCLFLGTLIGTSSCVTSVCCDTAQSGYKCNQLLKLDDAQAANLLLCKCHVPRLNNLARNVRPDLLVPDTTIYDSQTRSTFCHLIGYMIHCLTTTGSKFLLQSIWRIWLDIFSIYFYP